MEAGGRGWVDSLSQIRGQKEKMRGGRSCISHIFISTIDTQGRQNEKKKLGNKKVGRGAQDTKEKGASGVQHAPVEPFGFLGPLQVSMKGSLASTEVISVGGGGVEYPEKTRRQLRGGSAMMTVCGQRVVTDMENNILDDGDSQHLHTHTHTFQNARLNAI